MEKSFEIVIKEMMQIKPENIVSQLFAFYIQQYKKQMKMKFWQFTIH